MQKTILIGNSINLMSEGYSWRDLLTGLIEYIGKSPAIKFKREKPFTLLYQEILIRANRYTPHREKELKSFIIKSLEKIKHNDYHKKYVELGFKNILTTNYDYNLESSLEAEFNSANVLRETKFNLFRRKKVKNKYVWHIHGEIESPSSITLGYDHYVGYLSEMNKYVSSGTTTRKEKIRSAVKSNRINFENDSLPYSWIDLFLKDEIHIVGLSLDYTELDLWWLITFKEKLRDTNPTLGKTYFYYFTKEEDELDNVARREEAHQDTIKISLLDSYGVVTKPIIVNNGNYQNAHDLIIEKLKRIL